MNKKSFYRFYIVFLISFFYFATCFAGNKDEVKIALNADPETINILEYKTSRVLTPFIDAIHQRVLGETDLITGMRKLELAESVKVMENKKDVLLKLKKGVKFHTGDPLTVHDVKFTIEQCQDPRNANTFAGSLDEIESMEIVDDYTLIFHFYEPFAPWQEVMRVGIASKKYYEKVGRKKFRKNPVGSGPFRFVKRRISEHIILEGVENHPDYNGEFKRIKLMIVTDPVTRVNMLKTGEVDLIYEILPHQIKELKGYNKLTVKSAEIPSLYYLSIKPSLFPVIKDKNVRLAITHGINRQEIINRIYLKQGYPLYMWANKGELGYDPKIVIEYNPQKARDLLKKSSYKPGTPIYLTYTSAMPNSSIVALMIQHYLKNIGMTVKLQQIEYGAYLTYARDGDKRSGHMALSVFTTVLDPQVRLMMSMISDAAYCYYKDRPNQKKMDDLILAQAAETDPKKRLKILAEIHQINYEDPGNITLYGLNLIYAMNNKIKYSWKGGSPYLRDLYRIKLNK